MQLTKYTDYSMRVLIYLALLPEGRLASIDAISDAYDISRNNVNKIIHQLGKADVIHTKRGKGGGFYLAKSPDQINLGEMVLLLENTLQVVNCHSPACVILPACKLKSLLGNATNAFIDSLRQHTLADLIDTKRHNLISILEL
jgi:Rrf2 family nitric oxide-sensitive transcriptional repressor